MNLMNIYPNPSYTINMENSQLCFNNNCAFEFQFHYIQSLNPMQKITKYALTYLEPYYGTDINNARLFFVKPQYIEKYYNVYRIYHQFLFQLNATLVINFNIIELLEKADPPIQLNTVFFFNINHHNYKPLLLNFNFPINEQELRYVLLKAFKTSETMINDILILNNYISSQFVLKSLKGD